MTAVPTDALDAYAAVAERLARAAGDDLLRRRRGTALATRSKGQRRELVTTADQAAEQIVVAGLLAEFPEHAVFAEEGVLTTAGRASRAAEWTWFVDPLDGTTNYVHGLPFYAVALGLAHHRTPVVGVVHAPALGETFVAVAGGGAVRHRADGGREPLTVSATRDLADALLATGFSYNRNEPGRDDNAASIARVLPRCRDLRRLGSAELDLCLVAAGSYDGYWERYLAPYDVAAGAVVVAAAGGRISDLAGGDDWLFGGSIVASNGHLHDELRALLAPP